jgi:hypothetical protein
VKRVLIIAVVMYVAGYAVFRQSNTEIWAKDGKAYVIFPNTAVGKLAYYTWRPLSYLDSSLFQTGFHIGPHQDIST